MTAKSFNSQKQKKITLNVKITPFVCVSLRFENDDHHNKRKRQNIKHVINSESRIFENIL